MSECYHYNYNESLNSCFIYWQDLTVITRSTEFSFVTASIVYFSAGRRRVWHWDKFHHSGASEHPPYAEGLLQLYLHTTGINRCLTPMGCYIPIQYCVDLNCCVSCPCDIMTMWCQVHIFITPPLYFPYDISCQCDIMPMWYLMPVWYHDCVMYHDHVISWPFDVSCSCDVSCPCDIMPMWSHARVISCPYDILCPCYIMTMWCLMPVLYHDHVISHACVISWPCDVSCPCYIRVISCPCDVSCPFDVSCPIWCLMPMWCLMLHLMSHAHLISCPFDVSRQFFVN